MRKKITFFLHFFLLDKLNNTYRIYSYGADNKLFEKNKTSLSKYVSLKHDFFYILFIRSV